MTARDEKRNPRLVRAERQADEVDAALDALAQREKALVNSGRGAVWRKRRGRALAFAKSALIYRGHRLLTRIERLAAKEARHAS